MAGIIDRNNWKKNYLLSHSPFCSTLSEILEDIYSYLDTQDINLISSNTTKDIINTMLPKDKLKIYTLLSKIITS